MDEEEASEERAFGSRVALAIVENQQPADLVELFDELQGVWRHPRLRCQAGGRERPGSGGRTSASGTIVPPEGCVKPGTASARLPETSLPEC
jgi:hypothetical protein